MGVGEGGALEGGRLAICGSYDAAVGLELCHCLVVGRGRHVAAAEWMCCGLVPCALEKTEWCQCAMLRTGVGT